MLGSVGLFLHELLHPGSLAPHGGYWFWSGIASDIGEVTIIGGLVAIYRHHICHVDGCRKLGHIDPKVNAPACKAHHSLGHLHGKSHGASHT